MPKKNGDKRPQREQGRCVFCDGTKNISKEHVFSEWVNGVIERKEISSWTPGPILNFTKRLQKDAPPLSGQPIASIEIRPPRRRRPSPLTQTQIRKVCETCNNEWMGKIVNQAKPFAESMITGRECVLDQSAQQKLSSWIALACIMAEFTDPPTAGIPVGDRKYIMSEGEPPQTWTISVGRYSGTVNVPSRYRHHGNRVTALSSTTDADLSKFDFQSQSTAYILGSLLVFAFSSSSEPMARGLRENLNHRHLLRIWPVTEAASWPCTIVLGDDHFTDIADRFHAEIIRAFGT